MVSSYSASSFALGGASYANGAEVSLVPEASASHCLFAVMGAFAVCALGVISFSRLKARIAGPGTIFARIVWARKACSLCRWMR